MLTEKEAWLKIAKAFDRPHKLERATHLSLERDISLCGLCFALSQLHNHSVISSETYDKMNTQLTSYLRGKLYAFGDNAYQLRKERADLARQFAAECPEQLTTNI